MNANDMNFRQKDLKTIFNKNQIKIFVEIFSKVPQLKKL